MLHLVKPHGEALVNKHKEIKSTVESYKITKKIIA